MVVSATAQVLDSVENSQNLEATLSKYCNAEDMECCLCGITAIGDDDSYKQFCDNAYDVSTVDDYINNQIDKIGDLTFEKSTWEFLWFVGGRVLKGIAKGLENGSIAIGRIKPDTLQKIGKYCSKFRKIGKAVRKGYKGQDKARKSIGDLIGDAHRDFCNDDDNKCQSGYKFCDGECCEHCSTNLEGKYGCTPCELYKGSDNYDKDMGELYPESFYFNGLKHNYCVYKDGPCRCKINEECKYYKFNSDNQLEYKCITKCNYPYKNSDTVFNKCICQGESNSELCCPKGKTLCTYKINAWRHDKVMYYSKDEPVTLPRYEGDDEYTCCKYDTYCSGITFYEDETPDLSKVCVEKDPCNVDNDDSSHPAPSWGINDKGYADCICPSDTVPCGTMSIENLKKPENSNMKCCLSEEVCIHNEKDDTYECKSASSLCDEEK